MLSHRKKLKSGDILEFNVDGGLAYLNYIGRHPFYGDAVLVAPKIQSRRPESMSGMFADGYIIFYPAGTALTRQMVQIVGHLTPPALPTRLRRPGTISNDGQVMTWIVDDDVGEVVKKNLSNEELKLPIGEVWNHDFLMQRLIQGGSSLQEVPGARTDADAIKEVKAVSSPGALHEIRHYLYLPRKEDAQVLSRELQNRGFRVEDRLGGDGVNWVVLARHEAPISEELIASTRRSMEELVSKVGGEYDGWEADVRLHSSGSPSRH